MNYRVFFGNEEYRKNYVLDGLVKETGFQTTDSDVPLMNLKGDDLIQNLYYDEKTNQITYYGISLANKEIEELPPRKFVKKMKEIKSNIFEVGQVYLVTMKDSFVDKKVFVYFDEELVLIDSEGNKYKTSTKFDSIKELTTCQVIIKSNLS